VIGEISGVSTGLRNGCCALEAPLYRRTPRGFPQSRAVTTGALDQMSQTTVLEACSLVTRKLSKGGSSREMASSVSRASSRGATLPGAHLGIAER